MYDWLWCLKIGILMGRDNFLFSPGEKNKGFKDRSRICNDLFQLNHKKKNPIKIWATYLKRYFTK